MKCCAQVLMPQITGDSVRGDSSLWRERGAQYLATRWPQPLKRDRQTQVSRHSKRKNKKPFERHQSSSWPLGWLIEGKVFQQLSKFWLQAQLLKILCWLRMLSIMGRCGRLARPFTTRASSSQLALSQKIMSSQRSTSGRRLPRGSPEIAISSLRLAGYQANKGAPAVQVHAAD